jgi:hypothetical protein
MKAGSRPQYIPLSTSEYWLLNACTQPKAAAQTAWEQWRAHCRVETADARSQAMFGLLYLNLIVGLDSPEANLLKGIYKRTWYANQLALAKLHQIYDGLAVNGTPAVVLNDASLVGGHYPDIGCRAIRCIDLLFRAEHWEKGITWLTGEGWKVQPDKSFASATSLSIVSLSGSDNQNLRVWTNPFTAEPQEDTETRTWESARDMELNGKPVLTLGPVEQILSLSADARRVAKPPLFVVTDAMVLLQSLTCRSDWTRLVWRAQRYEHILPLRNMLAFLQAAMSAALPSWVLPALHKMAISHGELLQYHRACESLPLRLKSALLRGLRYLRPGKARGG